MSENGKPEFDLVAAARAHAPAALKALSEICADECADPEVRASAALALLQRARVTAPRPTPETLAAILAALESKAGTGR